MKRNITIGVFLLLLAATLCLAQESEPKVFVVTPQNQGTVIEQRGVAGGVRTGVLGGVKGGVVGGVPEGVVVVSPTEFMVDGKTVKGAPYSAESITETVQPLVDGNRIVHNSASKIYRDSEGRTRREMGAGAQGISVVSSPAWTSFSPRAEVLISDPVAGVSYSLDTEAKTARKMSVNVWRLTGDKKTLESGLVASMAQGQTVTLRAGADKKAVEDALVAAKKEAAEGWVSVQPLRLKTEKPGDMSEESLGTQVIEGVQAEGKRETTTIPAGKIGNELPIVITNETWYSPKLQTIVLSKRHDPRFGDTTFRLANISQDEPPASLFQVPSDYTVVDAKTPVKLTLPRPTRKEYE